MPGVSRALALSALGLLVAPRPAAAEAPRFEVVLLGTGFPRPDAEHAGPATAVVVGDRWFLVDAGRAVSLRLAAADLPYEALGAVLLTHLHSDHTAGLPDVFHNAWQFGRKTVPFPLYGPDGVDRLARALTEFLAEDIHVRRDLTEKLPGAGATVATHVVRPGVVLEDADVRVTAFAVDHRPVVPAYGYSFESHGRKIVISGDTRPTETLVRAAEGADVLVQEAYLPEHFLKVDTPEVAARLMSYHTSAEEAGQIAARAHVKTLVLTHLIPANEEETFRARAARAFTGTLLVGRDLLRVRVGD